MMFNTNQPGPMYEDFVVGAQLPRLPSITLTEADNALYRAITGDQHALAANVDAYRAASGSTGALANPALVMQCSIGQTTMATRQAIANLYYRSVRVLRPVEIGETLSTETVVLGLRDSSPKDEKVRGKVWLGIETSTAGGLVARYERCALVRGRGSAQPGHANDIPRPPDPTRLTDVAASTADWDLTNVPATDWPVGDVRTDPLRDHIDMAAPLARMTFNQAAVHRDHTLTANGQRLVFGGHVQGLAQASLTRMMPGLAMVVAWDGCDHLGPAHEGDLLEFEHRLIESGPTGSGRLFRFEVVGSTIEPDSERTPVLRWTPIVWGP
jgi:2-methylfumaryl-CoA hydratase